MKSKKICYQVFTGRAYTGVRASGEIFRTKSSARQWLLDNGFKKARGEEYYETDDGDAGTVAVVRIAYLHN